MKFRRFGKTGWTVSEIGFGCWGLGGGWGPRDDAEAKRALERALELGIDFFDTAAVYGGGHSERILGEVLRKTKRPFRSAAASGSRTTNPSWRVATKVPAKTMEWPARPEMKISQAFPTEWIVRCTEASLKRLGLERIDLQQMHVWTDAWVEAEEWRKAADRLKREGKIQAFGVSVNDHEPDSVLKLVATGEIDSVQVIYNIFEQAPEAKLFPLAQEHGVAPPSDVAGEAGPLKEKRPFGPTSGGGVAVIARVPFDEGSLSGAFQPVMRFPRGDWRAGYFRGERLQETCERVERLKPLLDADSPTLSALALQFALSHPAVSTVIPGMRAQAHVEANCAVSDLSPLSAQKRAKLKANAWARNFYVGARD